MDEICFIYSHDRSEVLHIISPHTSGPKKERKMDKNLLKELSVEELKNLEKQVKSEIERRTIKVVEKDA